MLFRSIRHNSPYHSPLSTPAWFLYAGILHVTFKLLAFIIPRVSRRYRAWETCIHSRDRYQGWILGGVDKAAEETASERSSKIDLQILDWTIGALGDDDSLKMFFEAVPGFFKSKLVKHLERRSPTELVQIFKNALGGFLIRTLSSNSVDESEKFRRRDISLNAIKHISKTPGRSILHNILFQLRDEMPQTVETGHTLARWFTYDQDIPAVVQHIIAGILVNVRERNDSWVTLAAQIFHLSERDLQDDIALGGDNVLLAILIHVTRQSLRPDIPKWVVLGALSKFDIRNTVPRLQHDFCTLWNEIVRKAMKYGPYTTSASIPRMIRHLYVALHQGTDAAPTAFTASTHDLDRILRQPSSYPFCNIASHHPDSTADVSDPLPSQHDDSSDASSPPPTDDDNTASRQPEQIKTVIQPITSEIGPTSHSHSMTLPTTTLVHPLEGSEQQDSHIVALSTEPGASQILPTASARAPVPTLMPISTSIPNASLEPYEEGAGSVPNSSHFPPPSVRSSIPFSRLTGSASLPRLRARGLVGTSNICFANTVLQLLVITPPFWNLFRELDVLKGQRGAGFPEAGGYATPLVDATVRFFKEFIVEEQPPSESMQQQPQLVAGGTSRADEEKKEDSVFDSFEPTYLYDAMKEKRHLKPLLVRSRTHSVAFCY